MFHSNLHLILEEVTHVISMQNLLSCTLYFLEVKLQLKKINANKIYISFASVIPLLTFFSINEFTHGKYYECTRLFIAIFVVRAKD